MIRRIGLVIGVALVGACAAKSGKAPDTAAPMGSAAGGDAAAAEADMPDDGEAAEEGLGDDDRAAAQQSPGDLEAELAALENDLARLGVAIPGLAVATGDETREAKTTAVEKSKGKKRASTPRKQETNRCERICALGEATCALEARICDLAVRHGGDDRYARACTRAGEDCRAAEEACHACAD